MTDPLSQLSDAERELITDFLRKHSDAGDRLADEPLTLGDDVDVTTAQAAFEQVMALVSEGDELDMVALRAMTLSRLETDIKSKHSSIISPSTELPSDADITREKLNRLLVRDELANYFLLSGALIERFTIDLVMEQIVSDERRSQNHRSRLERMSEREREDLLYMAGVLDDGEKSEIRRAYGLRNELAHSIDPATVAGLDNVTSDIERTRETLDMLHEKLHGIGLNHRFSNLLMDDGGHN